MRALIIGPEEKAALQAAFERAKAKPIDVSKVVEAAKAIPQGKSYVSLDDKKKIAGRDWERPPSECVDLPVGFMVCVSIEQQPAGLCVHFSISVDAPGQLPSPQAVEMILDEFGFALTHMDTAWIEEFMLNGEPGGRAINLVGLMSAGQVGHG